MSSGTDTDLAVSLPSPTIKILGPVGETVTVRVSGDLDARAAVALTVASDREAVLFDAAVVADLSDVGYFTMEAAAELLLLVRRCDELGREVRVLASPTVRHKLTMLGLAHAHPAQLTTLSRRAPELVLNRVTLLNTLMTWLARTEHGKRHVTSAVRNATE